MTYAAAAFVVLAFIALATRFGIGRRVRTALNDGRNTLALLRDAAYADDRKEQAVRRQARASLAQGVVIAAAAALALALPLAAVFVLAHCELVNFGAVLDALASWQLLAPMTLLLALAAALRRR